MIKNVLMSTIVLATMLGLFALPVSAQQPDKVFVCKYVGTPGVDERLQTGNNPISVSVNAIPDYKGIGSEFADKQGRSVVIAVDTRTGNGQEGEPSVDDCPAAKKPVTPVENGNPQNPVQPVVPGGQDSAPTQAIAVGEAAVLPSASGSPILAITLIAAGLSTIVTGVAIGFNSFYRRSV